MAKSRGFTAIFGKEPSNLGLDIGLTESKLLKVVHMESVVVAPEHRGNGLLGKMLKFAEQHIDKTKYKYLMSTISPNNPSSFHTFEKRGYVHVLTKEKYGIFFEKDISKKNSRNQAEILGYLLLSSSQLRAFFFLER